MSPRRLASGSAHRAYTFLPQEPGVDPAAVAHDPPPQGAEANGSSKSNGLPFRAVPALDGINPARVASGSSSQIPDFLYRFCDDAVVLGAIVAAVILTNTNHMPQGLDRFVTVRFNLPNVLLGLVFWMTSRAAFAAFGLYRSPRRRSTESEFRGVFLACTVLALVTLLFPITDPQGAFGYDGVVAFWLLCTSGMMLFRAGLRRVAALGRVRVRNTLVVGTGPRAMTICRRLLSDETLPRFIVGFVDSEDGRAACDLPAKVVGGLQDLPSTLLHAPIDEVIVALPVKSRYEDIQDVIDTCERMGVPVSLPGDAFQSSRGPFHARVSEEHVTITLEPQPRPFAAVLKRLIDVAGGSIGLVLSAPVMLLAAVAVMVTSRGPILFAQERYGRSRRRFRMYKFRTMVMEAESLLPILEHLNEAQGPLFKIGRDPRLTAVGGFLRRTSIDELPQLYNVLRGDMSLVGPRPLSLRDVYRLPEAALARRFSVPQGLTGLWQVEGRSRLKYHDWMNHDLNYVDQWSLRLDLRILLRTIPAVIRGDGAQ